MEKLETMSEKELQKKVIAWLQKMESKGEILFEISQGLSDIVLYSRTLTYHNDSKNYEPTTIFLELRTDIGKSRPRKIGNRNKIKAFGFEYYVLRPKDWIKLKENTIDYGLFDSLPMTLED